MDLRQLEYVVAIADHGSFTAAARACFVAQPSLSLAVRAVEREVGVELFTRGRRGAVLTAAGESFVARARVVLREMEALTEVGSQARQLLAGRLDLVALPTLFDVVARLVGELRRRHPGLSVRLAHPETVDDLVDRLVDGRSEIGLAELPMRRGGLVATPIGRQELVAVGHVAALPSGSGALGPQALAELPLIAPPPGTSTRRAVEEACARAGVAARIVVETGQREAIGPMAAAGAGVAVLPRAVAEQLAAEHGMAVRALRPPLARRIGLVQRRAELSPAGAAFRQVAVG